MKKQCTIKKRAEISGIGVHTGSKTTMVFCPASINSGIKFVRVDLPDKPEIKAGIESVVETARGTILGNATVRIHTVEHVMAALWAFGITNLTIELDADEPPVGDGSSDPFVNIIKEAGVVEQEADSTIFKVTEPITITEGDAFLTVLPYEGFKVTYTLAYNHPVVNTQYYSLDIDKESFVKEISPCRTFCFYHEVKYLMDKGLIQGGSLDNAVVIGDEAILSKEGLRFENEFARHKMLDIIGDLYLLGIRLEGHIVAAKSGHSSNVKLAQMLYEKYLRVNQKPVELNSEQIKKLLPHRYPFLLVDRIVNITKEGCVGIKNVTVNEEFFNGHFPVQALMPGVLQIEAMAQVVGVGYLFNNAIQNKMAILAGVEKARFRKTIVPGDQLIIDMKFGKFRKSIGTVHGCIRVKNEIVSEAELIVAIIEVKQ